MEPKPFRTRCEDVTTPEKIEEIRRDLLSVGPTAEELEIRRKRRHLPEQFRQPMSGWKSTFVKREPGTPPRE